MQKTITLIYVIITATFAVYTTILESQPALFLIDLMAPRAGDKYSATLVILLVWFMFLLPLAIILIIAKKLRAKPMEVISPDRTGVYVTREKAFQSAVVGIPVFINYEKVGIVDNGKTQFFDVPVGGFTIQAGKGKQASELLESELKSKDQLNFEFRLTEAGLFNKIVLLEVDGPKNIQ